MMVGGLPLTAAVSLLGIALSRSKVSWRAALPGVALAIGIASVCAGAVQWQLSVRAVEKGVAWSEPGTHPALPADAELAALGNLGVGCAVGLPFLIAGAGLLARVIRASEKQPAAP